MSTILTAIAFLLRIFSLLYHLGLSLLFCLLGLIPMLGGGSLKLPEAPWSEASLPLALLLSGLAGLLLTVLAALGRLRILFVLWSLAVLAMLFRGYFWSTYQFASEADFNNALYLVLGALLAFFGAWSIFRRKRARSR